VVRDEQGHAARAAVCENGLYHLAQVSLGGHIGDGVVHEDRVERPPEPQRPHVALMMRALGVEAP
jgi:hypothetical protein